MNADTPSDPSPADPPGPSTSREWIEDPTSGWVPADGGDWAEPLPRRPWRRVLWAVVAVIVLLVATLVPYRRIVSDDAPPRDPSTSVPWTVVDA